MLAERTE